MGKKARLKSYRGLHWALMPRFFTLPPSHIRPRPYQRGVKFRPPPTTQSSRILRPRPALRVRLLGWQGSKGGNGLLRRPIGHCPRILLGNGERCTQVVKTVSTDDARVGSISTGPLVELIGVNHTQRIVVHTPADLPFSLNGHVEDRDEAELRLARALKEETAFKDGYRQVVRALI